MLLVGCSRSAFLRGIGPASLEPPHEHIVERVIFIGDAGEPSEEEPSLQLLDEWVRPVGPKATVVFLGDNIYEKGLPPVGVDGHEKAKARFEAQLLPVRDGGGRAIVIPGNHDWRQPDGVAGIERQAAALEQYLGERGQFVPDPGCPGPAVIGLRNLRIVAVDTEWWLQDDEHRADRACARQQSSEVTSNLRDALQAGDGRPVVLIGHHPIVTHGHHGGHRSWRDRIFPLRRWKKSLWIPLPGMGLLHSLLTSSRQDTQHDRNQLMARDLSWSLRAAAPKPLLYVAGHEHNLQILDGEGTARYLLVSGSGAKVESVGRRRNTRFALAAAGFMVLDFVQAAHDVAPRMILRVVEVQRGVVAELPLLPK